MPEVALDTEGDSLHHYPGRLALIQLADATGAAWLVDPLALADLRPLAAVFGDPARRIVLHAGDNDLADLKGRHGFRFASLFDTSIAARFLGARGLGLDTLLREYLGVDLPPSRQKDDWSERPLSEAQERYAVADVSHLIDLKNRLVEDLRRAGRWAWVEEECAAMAAEPPLERFVDADAWAHLKGARELRPRGLALLRELHAAREALARAADRPPFKVFSDATLVALAAAAPRDREVLARVPGCTERVIARWGGAILTAVGRAEALADRDLPALPRSARPVVPGPVRRRIEALRLWRVEAAPRLGLDPGLLLPNRLIRVIAEAGPRDIEALAAVAGVRGWRVELAGREIVAALAVA